MNGKKWKGPNSADLASFFGFLALTVDRCVAVVYVEQGGRGASSQNEPKRGKERGVQDDEDVIERI